MINDTLQKIDLVVSRINAHPDYSSHVLREGYHALREEAEKHSLDIELLSEGRRLSPRERKLFLDRLDQAFNLISREGIIVYTLSKLGPLIEPDNNPTKGFRTAAVSFGGFYAPEPEKVPYRIQNLVELLQDPRFHPVIRAANAHLELVEIHPYMDGNGRSARLLQNLCLQQRSYPAAVIPTGDLKEYLLKIHNALKDRYDGKSNIFKPSQAELDFQEFIAQRVLQSANFLGKELEGRKFYDVKITKLKAPGIGFAIAKLFKNVGKRSKEGGVLVSIDKKSGKRNSEILRVVGPLDENNVRKVLNDCSKKYGISFEVTRKG